MSLMSVCSEVHRYISPLGVTTPGIWMDNSSELEPGKLGTKKLKGAKKEDKQFLPASSEEEVQQEQHLADN